MKFQLAVLSLFCGASSVHSFVPQHQLLLNTNHLASSSDAAAVLRSSSSSSRRFMSTAAPAESGTATEEVELTPEYQAALEQAKATVTAVLEKAKPELLPSVIHFCNEYMTATQVSYQKYPDPEASPEGALRRILEGVQYGYKFGMGEGKFEFGVTHDALRGDDAASEEIGSTFDFYEWGCNFFKYFMDIEESQVLGQDNLKKAMDQAAKGENVVFYANHQSEADPQVMTYMLEKVGYAKEASKIIYVAGHKVTTDALAIPFSMGRNLICIHSKKHIDTDPDTKSQKSRQNMMAMGGMLKKLKAGGCLLWVAPSGGRDRRDVDTGKTPIAPFDSKTIDMFRLMGRKSKIPTHYYPLSMVSYELCPPPDFIEAGTGEQRNFRFVPVGIKVGDEIDDDDGNNTEAFNPGAYDQTVRDYYELRERIFPGSAPEQE